MAAGNEDRLYNTQSRDADLLENESFDYRTAGARLLGRDIVPLLNAETKSLVSRILDQDQSSESVDQLVDIVNQNRLRNTDDDELVRENGTFGLAATIRKYVSECLAVRVRQRTCRDRSLFPAGLLRVPGHRPWPSFGR